MSQLLDSAKQHHQAGRLGEAESLYRQAIAQKPDDLEAMHLLAVLLAQTQRATESVQMLRKILTRRPDWAAAHGNLANVLVATGELEPAIAEYRRAVELSPQFVEAHSNLSNALRLAGRYEEAIAAARAALTIRPNHAPAFVNLGYALDARGDKSQAAAAYEKAISIRPDFAEAYSNLGTVYASLGRLDDGIAACRRAIALQPTLAEAHLNLGNALQATGRLDEALASFQKASDLNPSYLKAMTNRLFALYFHPGFDAAAIYREHQKLDQRFIQPLRGEIRKPANDRNPDRRLKIGYVSPDFYRHCQSFFTVPLLSNHDHANFEIVCYADVPKPDETTRRLRGYADEWRSTVGVSDEKVAEMIRGDGIDILVDLTMHMANGRAQVFARKPAPVQVTWLAYPGTTGISAIDYRLTDSHLDPVGLNDAFYAEKSIRLPETFWCYDPLTAEPKVNELPTLSSGRVTFGCLNNFCKVNEGTIRLWERVLKSVPNSRLILLCPEGEHRRKLSHLPIEFVEHRPREDYLKLYQRIDIGLDTFPYNGHTTSLDSLWMGVPVVSMEGATAVSRAAISQTNNLGMKDDWVGKTSEDFIKIAVRWASDLPRLSELRRNLRQKMEQSPLMDGKKFARNMEAAFRQMWRSWCQVST
jgi:predicted O-linked N-acetylglucosamine transferase (SPINDLY family)